MCSTDTLQGLEKSCWLYQAFSPSHGKWWNRSPWQRTMEWRISIICYRCDYNNCQTQSSGILVIRSYVPTGNAFGGSNLSQHTEQPAVKVAWFSYWQYTFSTISCAAAPKVAVGLPMWWGVAVKWLSWALTPRSPLVSSQHLCEFWILQVSRKFRVEIHA